ncbi:MAG: hypothetical protein D6805_08325 [Planctomycetota bacterium]|nr:MAG: hypothetical protein D6805_08325 [Planctomycetota bacterium]
MEKNQKPTNKKKQTAQKKGIRPYAPLFWKSVWSLVLLLWIERLSKAFYASWCNIAKELWTNSSLFFLFEAISIFAALFMKFLALLLLLHVGICALMKNYIQTQTPLSGQQSPIYSLLFALFGYMGIALLCWQEISLIPDQISLELIWKLIWKSCVWMGILGILELILARYFWQTYLKMSLEELKEEKRAEDGAPEKKSIFQKHRQLQRAKNP